MTVPTPAAAQVPSVMNLRDMGGIATASGQRIAPGRLWRSSHFAELAPSDAPAIEALGLRCVIDLRGALERERAPSRLAQPALRELHLPIEPRAMGALRDLRAAGAVDEQALAAIMREVYRRFVRQHASVFANFLRLLGDDTTPLPLVFHCTAGKDRTGWAAALTLLALGVPREAVIADFMQSNGRWRMQGEAADWALLASVRADYLACAFEEIERGWGSTDAYLSSALGQDEAARQRLRGRLLVDC
jgi:protein-tyrosine phosphatase